jgi:nucleoside-triphosphatase THEP1
VDTKIAKRLKKCLAIGMKALDCEELSIIEEISKMENVLDVVRLHVREEHLRIKAILVVLNYLRTVAAPRMTVS